MSSELNNILEVTDWSMVLIALVAIIGFFVAAIKTWKYIRDYFGIETKDTLAKQRQQEEIQELQNKISQLEKQHDDFVQHSNSNDKEIQNSIAELKQIMVDHIKEDKRREDEEKEVRIATFRSTLYHIYKEAMGQGYIDRDGLQTFMECVKIYEASGGNDIVHSKLKPEVLALPIKD